MKLAVIKECESAQPLPHVEAALSVADGSVGVSTSASNLYRVSQEYMPTHYLATSLSVKDTQI